MTNYRRGVATEYKCIEVLEAAGYVAQRSAGSHGPWDVCAVGGCGVRLIQLKRVKQGGSWKGDYDLAVEQMRGLPDLPGVSREVWVWEDRVGWVKQEVVE